MILFFAVLPITMLAQTPDMMAMARAELQKRKQCRYLQRSAQQARGQRSHQQQTASNPADASIRQCSRMVHKRGSRIFRRIWRGLDQSSPGIRCRFHKRENIVFILRPLHPLLWIRETGERDERIYKRTVGWTGSPSPTARSAGNLPARSPVARAICPPVSP